MATPISQLKATAAELAARIVGAGLLVWNETAKRWHGGDGVTMGGIAMARYDERNEGALGYLERVETDAANDVVAGDSGKVIVGNRATAIAFNLASAATLGAGFVAIFKNINTGAMTIVPNGAEEIDGANAAITVPNGSSLVLKGDGAAFRTYLSNADVTGTAINGAPALSGANLEDDDKLGVYDASAGALASILVSELVAGIFRTARKIANGYFLSSFRIWDITDNTKGIAFDLSGIPTATTRTLKPFNVGAFAILQDQKPSGTTGGNSVVGWQTRNLNTEVFDPDNIVSIASNQFTPTIDCWCEVQSTGFLINQAALRIWNVTDGVEVVRGVVAYSGNAAPGYSVAPYVAARLDATKTYRIEMYANRAQASTGLGVDLGNGINVYTNVTLRGIA